MSFNIKGKTEEELRKKQYGIYNHSAVQVCAWTKKSLTGKGECYKSKFYNVPCHSCMEFSPMAIGCSQNCIFCWRPMELMKIANVEEKEVDNPEEIYRNLLEERKKLLSGFWGNEEVSKELLKDSIEPRHYAISLSGEPTLYPKLGELIKFLKSFEKTGSVFLVTNGQEEEFFEECLNNPEFLPTQFYVSLSSPNEEIFKEINRSVHKEGWKKFLQNIERFSKFDTRKVLRFTIIKGINDKDEHIKDYRELIKMSNADFIEVKAYMHLGESQKRLSKENMPDYEYIEEFSNKLLEDLENYEIVDGMWTSRICLLKRKDSKYSCVIDAYKDKNNSVF